MLELVFATNNRNKLVEVQQLLPETIQLLSLTDIGCKEEIPETAATLAGNAQLKADYVTKHYGYDCFADDTGLAVAALNGAPGVYSARYAGPDCSPEDNIQKLRKELTEKIRLLEEEGQSEQAKKLLAEYSAILKGE